MRRLAKNLILATAVVSAIFLVDLSSLEASTIHNATTQSLAAKKICPLETDIEMQYLDFWSKFRDTVMPDPDEPQDNNPPKEMKKPKPAEKPKPVNPKPVKPNPAH